MDISKLINVITATAAAILPNASEAIAAGEAVLDFVKDIIPTLSQEDQEALQAPLPNLLIAMNRDVDQGIADLLGTGG